MIRISELTDNILYLRWVREANFFFNDKQLFWRQTGSVLIYAIFAFTLIITNICVIEKITCTCLDNISQVMHNEVVVAKAIRLMRLDNS